MLERAPLGLLPGYLDLSTFRFQSQETPFHVSEMIVAAPADMEAELRGGAPAAVVTKKDGLQTHHWKVERSPRLGVEPQMRNSLYEVPSVRVYTDVSTEAWLAALGLRMFTTQRSNLELRQLTRRLTAGEKTARGKLEKLHRWVVENVEEVGELTVPATLTLSARKGSGMLLLKTMLREAGVRAELWIARDNFCAALKPDGNPLFESYDSPYLAVWTGEGGEALAKAHARTGDPAAISAYIGKGRKFTQVISDFARLYADQNDRDRAQLAAAIADGTIESGSDS